MYNCECPGPLRLSKAATRVKEALSVRRLVNDLDVYELPKDRHQSTVRKETKEERILHGGDLELVLSLRPALLA